MKACWFDLPLGAFINPHHTSVAITRYVLAAWDFQVVSFRQLAKDVNNEMNRWWTITYQYHGNVKNTTDDDHKVEYVPHVPEVVLESRTC